jgi:FtsP/CotA-like multicopper oxidase with cupredoxin domain
MGRTLVFCVAIRIVAAALALILPVRPATALPPDSESGRSIVVPNDNRTPAGQVKAGVLELTLRAARGSWQPEGPAGPRLSVEAFGDGLSALSLPAPLIRTTAGTPIAVTLRNELDSVLQVHGLCARDGSPCVPVTVPSREQLQVQFRIERPGTYHYWATTMGAPVPFGGLAGALIIDPPGETAAADRVLVITEWTSLTAAQLGGVMQADDSGKAFVALKPRLTFVINGLSWPATERFTYRLGDTARWRVINLSSQAHPMHLHGFYFDVDSVGDGMKDTPVPAADRHPVVTQLMPPASTMSLAWTPERPGNWLFHCHLMHHVSTERRLTRPAETAHDHGDHDRSSGMAGMILGVTVLGEDAPRPAKTSSAAPRRLTLTMERHQSYGEQALGFGLAGDRVAATASAVSSPGPLLALRKGEPVEITIVNKLGERTALHWHGMELDSYYDGVHNWSGIDKTLAPMIEPDQSFVVRFTPPRTGTFMYHTHLHDERQLPLGLYGPMLVLDDEQSYRPEVDHVVMIGRTGIDPAAPDVLIPATPLVINGETSPVIVWKAGTVHRVRLINITPDSIVSVSLQSAAGALTWTSVTKDGSPLPASARQPKPSRQTIAPGETYDFEVELPPGRRNVWLEVRSPAGKWEAQAQVIAK